MSYSDDYDGYNEFDDVNEIPASELGATFASLTSGGNAINSSGPGGISLDASMGDDREALRQRDRARDREEREREMDRGMTDRERERTVRRRSSKGECSFNRVHSIFRAPSSYHVCVKLFGGLCQRPPKSWVCVSVKDRVFCESMLWLFRTTFSPCCLLNLSRQLAISWREDDGRQCGRLISIGIAGI